MEAASEQADLLSSNIGLFSKTVSGDAIFYGECGSGVTFDRHGDVYYALTAAHVVSGENGRRADRQKKRDSVCSGIAADDRGV